MYPSLPTPNLFCSATLVLSRSSQGPLNHTRRRECDLTIQPETQRWFVPRHPGTSAGRGGVGRGSGRKERGGDHPPPDPGFRTRVIIRRRLVGFLSRASRVAFDNITIDYVTTIPRPHTEATMKVIMEGGGLTRIKVNTACVATHFDFATTSTTSHSS